MNISDENIEHRRRHYRYRRAVLGCAATAVFAMMAGGAVEVTQATEVTQDAEVAEAAEAAEVIEDTEMIEAAEVIEDTEMIEATEAITTGNTVHTRKVALDPAWQYASYSRINSGEAVLYTVDGPTAKKITVCINAGHGTIGGSDVKTQCHPDGTPKVTGGTTGAGAYEAIAVSSGMTFADGYAERDANLSAAVLTKEALLNEGYNVLMIRESEDVQLDNLARTVIANNMADCHIAIHYDSTDWDKGAFYCGVPDVESYRNMEPVRSCWEKSERLGQAVIQAFAKDGIAIYGEGRMDMDLTQTSYSSVPSIDLEIGDAASDHSQETQQKIAAGIVDGVNAYFTE